MMSRKCLRWHLHRASILAAAVAGSGLLRDLWLFALFIVGSVLAIVSKLHNMHGGSPTDSNRRAESQIDLSGDYTAVGASNGLRRHR